LQRSRPQLLNAAAANENQLILARCVARAINQIPGANDGQSCGVLSRFCAAPIPYSKAAAKNVASNLPIVPPGFFG